MLRDMPYGSSWSIVTPPDEYPITLAQLKSQLRIPSASTTEDDYLNMLIPAATDIVQRYLGRLLINTGLEAYIDLCDKGTNDGWWDGTRVGAMSSFSALREFELPWLPLQSVSEISTFDDSNTETTYDSDNYIIDDKTNDLWGRVILNRDSIWPSNLRSRLSIRVQYIVGYGASADDVPSSIIQGILNVAAFMYSNRGDCVEPSKCVSASGAMGFLKQYRVRRFG